MIIALVIVTSVLVLFNIILFTLWYFSNKKILKLIRVDLPPLIKSAEVEVPFLAKCAETARDNDDSLAKNIEIIAKRIIKIEKEANVYKSKTRSRNNSED